MNESDTRHRPPRGHASVSAVRLRYCGCNTDEGTVHQTLTSIQRRDDTGSLLPRRAAQAIEDGATLTACLTQTGPDIAEALRRYERLRIPRTSRLQFCRPPTRPVCTCPTAQQHQRDAQLATGSSDWTVGTVAWIYNHDPAALDLTQVPS